MRINRMIDMSREGKYKINLSISGMSAGSMVSVPAPAFEVDVTDPDWGRDAIGN